MRPAVDVLDRPVGRDVPGRHDERPADIGLPAVEHGLVDLPGDPRPDRPLPLVVEDVGGDPEVVLEHGRRPDVVAFVLLPLEDDLLDPVDEVVVPIEQQAAVEDAEKGAGLVGDGGGGHEHHALVFMVFGPFGGHGRRDELELGLIGEIGPLPEKLVGRNDPRSGGDVPAEGAGDDGISGDPVARRSVGTPRPDQDAAAGVGEVEDIEPEFLADLVQPAGDAPEGPLTESRPEDTPASR